MAMKVSLLPMEAINLPKKAMMSTKSREGVAEIDGVEFLVDT